MAIQKRKFCDASPGSHREIWATSIGKISHCSHIEVHHVVFVRNQVRRHGGHSGAVLSQMTACAPPERKLCPPSEDCAPKKLTGSGLLKCKSRPKTPKLVFSAGCRTVSNNGSGSDLAPAQNILAVQVWFGFTWAPFSRFRFGSGSLK